VVTAGTYVSVLPDSQRRCADATAVLVLTAARHPQRIKEKAAKNRPGGRDENAFREMARHQQAKPQVTLPPTPDPSRKVMTAMWHQLTHRPSRLDSKKGLTRVSAVQTPLNLVRPKGLEPLTF
jgi:hypothetical protein